MKIREPSAASSPVSILVVAPRNCSLHSLVASIQAAVYKTYGIVGRPQQRRVLFDLRRSGDHTTLRVLQYVLGQVVGGWIWSRKGDQEGLWRGSQAFVTWRFLRVGPYL